MNIALCHHYSLTFNGGGERFLIDIAHQLLKRGHHPVIYSLPFNSRSINLDKVLQGVEYHENFVHRIQDVDVAYFIYAPLVHNLFIGRFPRIGAIHAFVFLNELQHDEIKAMNHGNFIQEFGLLRFVSSKFFKKFQRSALNGFDAVHVINQKALGVLNCGRRTYYISNWIDTSEFKPVREKNTKFSVLFTGRREKGFSMFTRIANLLEGMDMKFYAIGPDLHGTRNVKNLGFITDVQALINLYSKVHVLVYTSKIDVFPLALLEAAACKIPIIAFPTSAIQGLNLPILYATSIQDFAQNIRELGEMWLRRTEEYANLSKQVREATRKYDVVHVFPKFLSMLKEVASLSPR